MSARRPPRSKLVDVAKGNPVQQLFTGGLALTTMLVWVVFFANLLNMYLFSYWMPTVLNLSGLKPEVAVFYASMFQLGGILSCLLLGPMIDRFGAPKVLACSFASGVIFILAVGLGNLPVPFIAIPILGAGAAMIGSQLGRTPWSPRSIRRASVPPASAGRSASAGSAASPVPQSAARCSASACRPRKSSFAPAALRWSQPPAPSC